MSVDRYKISELATGQEAGIFPTGKAVTIELFDLATGNAVSVDFNNCPEIGTTGIYRWWVNNITTLPSTFKQYGWVMTSNDGLKYRGEFSVAGWAENIDGAPIPADMCKVYADISEPTDLEGVEPTRLYSDLTKTYAQIQGTAYFNDRFFTTEKTKPSYTKLERRGYWLLPQGATVKFLITLLNINKVVTIPAQSEVNLNDLIA